MIQVTNPFLPPREEYEKYVDEIWQNGWLTNNGPLVKKLEGKLAEWLDNNNLLFTSNGTLALQLALKAFKKKGKQVITTPFSYVATTSSIVWEGFEPKFVDIDAETFNIQPEAVENAITPDTYAILATHVFGVPCNLEQLEEIANRHDVKIIYDAAHCFGTRINGQSLLNYGDISTVSFHATKLFHTIEGGAVITKDPEIKERVYRMRNFGHAGPGKFSGVGINGKNSEFHAAMGLCNLNYIDEVILKRKKDYQLYKHLFSQFGVNERLQFQYISERVEYNCSYMPVVFSDEKTLHSVLGTLNEYAIYPRRYFYPSLNKLDYVGEVRVKSADSISKRILCLPMYHGLKETEIELIVKLIAETLLS